MSRNKCRINPKTGGIEIVQVVDLYGMFDDYTLDAEGYLIVTSSKADRQHIDKEGRLVKEFKKGRII